ncbi:hypothetical protein CK498_24610 [Halomonas salipaludis]|uniref:Flavin reductase like domain-containing protein n=2 Tax=Halomonas salipaludis TaxID=2032625 RepID=A0A2A2ENZ8_9GAMM|nr:hypothetical protein CK498_24610 [Halomonas salipaludis]
MSDEGTLFRAAMARLGAAVNVITTDGIAGRGGFTATAVCSLSDNPPSILVCMNRGSAQNAIFRTNGALCVNILGEKQRFLADKFAGATREDTAARFASAQWEATDTGAPALADSLASIDTWIRQILEVATHDVMVCDVVRIRMNEPTSALIYFGRDYHALPVPAALS